MLITSFVVAGTLVYYATAPAAAPGSHGFSLSKIADHFRREVRGNRSSAEIKTSSTIPLKPGITEIRFETASAPLEIIGEERTDLACELQVWSSGYDESEAKKYAGETLLKNTESGPTLVLSISYPEPATQRASLVVRLPRRMAVRLQRSTGKTEVTDVASVDLVEARGQVDIRNVAGRVGVGHRGGRLAIASVGAIKLNTRGSVIDIKDVKGDATMQLQAGELRGASIAGAIEIESNGTSITLEDLAATRKSIRINALTGALTLAGISTETRVDSRDTRVEVQIERPVPVAIYVEGDDPLDVVAPRGGFQLDALVTDGDLSVPDGFPAVKSEGNEHRSNGAVANGGPLITLRAARGNMTIRARETTLP